MNAAAGGVFTLDLSSRTGWAYGPVGARTPLCGVWVLAEGDLGVTLASFDNELDDAIKLHRPRLLMVEAPLPPTATSHANTWRQQLGLAALAETAAYRHSVPYREVAASTVRAAIIGTARFPRGQAKPAILAYCQSQGWRVPDDNAGDACITWKFACREIEGRRRAA